MLDYRRGYVPGGTYFFTVNTYRRQTFLTEVDVRSALREAIETLLTHPFVIEACVLLPDHMHYLWTLPPGGADFSYRWRVIRRTGAAENGTKAPCGSIDSGNISSVMRPTSTGISVTSIGTP